jgi:NAD(P)-dependent dehydrogenase (short-subunit alcohol dehydrogenase family)
MELGLAGKAALVTGSSRGIGKAIAIAIAREGCRVALNGRDAAALGSAAAEFASPPLLLTGDVTQPAEARRVVQAAVDHFGALDIVVANVGSGRSVPPGTEDAAEWQRVFALNLWSTTNTVEAARGALAASRGCIVCISSICGLGVIPGAPVTYSVAKAALHAYVAGIARPLGADGIRITAVAPGNILFPGSVWERKLGEDAAAVQTMLRVEVPLARLGRPEEVADLVAYLASPRCNFASGSVWTLDGGQQRRY